MSDQSASIVGSDYDTPSKPVTFSFLTLARLFLRTWPDLKPQWKHSVAWFSLQFLSGVVVSLLSLILFDISKAAPQYVNRKYKARFSKIAKD